jgi:hypothetical protein
LPSKRGKDNKKRSVKDTDLKLEKRMKEKGSSRVKMNLNNRKIHDQA